MNYAEMLNLVNGKTNRKERKIGNNTYAEIEYDRSISVNLHGTDVVRFYPNGLVKLNSGGWRTHTTKQRINKYSPVKIFQKNFEWFLADGTPFEDNMLVGG
jgi:hypothetical protein